MSVPVDSRAEPAIRHMKDIIRTLNVALEALETHPHVTKEKIKVAIKYSDLAIESIINNFNPFK